MNLHDQCDTGAGAAMAYHAKQAGTELTYSWLGNARLLWKIMNTQQCM
jgi:hypothetical protein